MKKKYTLLGLAVLVLSLSCTPVLAEEFTLNQSKVTMNVNNDTKTDLDIIGSSKNPVWTTYNRNIVSVDKEGILTAKNTGKTTITARIGTKLKKCSVTVVKPSIKLNKIKVTLYHGNTEKVSTKIKLKATVKGASKTTVWKSSNPKVATVDQNGNIKPVHEGETIISATANGISAECVVTVKENSILLDHETMLLSTKGTGSSMKLKTTIVGPTKKVKWETEDKTIARVNGSGTVTGKKDGETYIKATANGVTAKCRVTVSNGLISINTEKVLLYVEGPKPETSKLKTNAKKKDVLTWTSANPKVATVDQKGLVTAVGEGETTVSVTANGKTDSCKVTVLKTKTDIKENQVTLTTKGTEKTYILNKEIIGRKTSTKWKSDNTKVVKVSNGKLTGVKAGIATVSMTANGKTDTVTVVVNNYEPTITLNKEEYVLYTNKGNTVTLKASVNGANKKVAWKSSDTSVATVNNKGKIVAVSEGTATITAEANGVTDSCKIQVIQSKINVDLETEPVLLLKKEKITIPVDVIGNSQSVSWKSSNAKVATVNSKGLVTAKKNGEADIIIKANNVTRKVHIIVDDCRHKYDNGKITKQASCTETGKKVFTCSVCKHTYEEVIPMKEHIPGKWEVLTEATCCDKGEEVLCCTVCKGTLKKREIPLAEHEYSDWIYEQRNGNKDDWEEFYPEETDFELNTKCPSMEKGEVYSQMRKSRYCDVCGHTESEKAHTHSFTKTSVTLCQESFDLYQCSTCHLKVYENAMVFLKPHDIHLEDEGSYLIDYKGKKTAIEDMNLHNSRYYICGTCRTCGETFEYVNAWSLDKLPLYAKQAGDKHEYVSTGEHVDATCTHYGYDIVKCKYCPNTTHKRTEEALGHAIPEKYNDYVEFRYDDDTDTYEFKNKIAKEYNSCLPSFTCERCKKEFVNENVENTLFFDDIGTDEDLAHGSHHYSVVNDATKLRKEENSPYEYKYGHIDCKCDICGKEKTEYYIWVNTEGCKGIMFPGESYKITGFDTDMPIELKEKVHFVKNLGAATEEDLISFDESTGIVTINKWNVPLKTVENFNAFDRFANICPTLGENAKSNYVDSDGREIVIRHMYNGSAKGFAGASIPEEEAGKIMQKALEDYEITDDMSDYQKIYRCYVWVRYNFAPSDWGTAYWEQEILKTETNCVGSTGLFEAFMARLNFKTRQNHEPGHVYNDVWYNGNWYTADCALGVFSLPPETTASSIIDILPIEIEEETETAEVELETEIETEEVETEITEDETETEIETVDEAEETETESETVIEESEAETEIEAEKPESEMETETQPEESIPTVSGNDMYVEEQESEEEEIE